MVETDQTTGAGTATAAGGAAAAGGEAPAPAGSASAAAGPASGSSAASGGSSASWEFLEVLAAVILAAESLRIVGSLIAGIINGLTTSAGLAGSQHVIGNAIDVAANYSDGPGIVLLLVSLAMLWWRAEYWTARLRSSADAGGVDGDLPTEGVQVHRLRALTRWALVLFIFAAAGAVAWLVGDVLVITSSHVSSSVQWQAYADDLFTLAYAVIAAAGIAASVKLVNLCDVAIDDARGKG